MLVHISNNFLGSIVHSELAKALCDRGVGPQFVYCPLQRKFKANPEIRPIDNVVVAAPRIFNQFLRYFPLLKVFWAYAHFLVATRRGGVKPSFIVAHNLWSDGMVAWLHYLFTGTRFVVAVRNTDINYFIPGLPHYRWVIKRILASSSCVVFVNNAYLTRMSGTYRGLFDSMSRFKTIYNGIDGEWFDLAKLRQDKVRSLKVCYVGSFSVNKNLKSSCLAIKQLNEAGHDIKFVAIGGSESEFLEAAEFSHIPDWVEVVPRTPDRAEIARRLQEARVFLMPSFKETFGLVYIEALTQGCCVIHSKGEGIDGVFDVPYVKSVQPSSIADIKDKMQELLENHPQGVPPSHALELTSAFSWSVIAEEYHAIISRAD